MILILQSVSNYNPNETAYKVVTLQTQLANLITMNNTANTSYATLKAARIDRNTFFYAVFGEVTTGQDIVKAVQQGDKITAIDILDPTEELFTAQKASIEKWNATLA